MVRTGTQAAPVQGWGTAGVERHPPVAAVVRSSGSPSSSTTTGVVTDVSTNNESNSGQTPLGGSVEQQTFRSATQGKGTFTMEFYCYRQVPKDVQEEVILARKKAAAEQR